MPWKNVAEEIEISSAITLRTSDDPNTLCKWFLDIIRSYVDFYAPPIQRKGFHKKCPFFDDDLIASKKNKGKKEREFRKQRTKAAQSDLSKAIEYQNLYYRKKKLFFDKNLCDISKAPDRKKFQILNSLLGKGCELKPPSFTNASALAERFVIFFRKKVCKITSKFSKFTVHCNKISPRFAKFAAVSEESLQRALAKTSASNSYHDVIPSTVFKDFSASFMPTIILLFNTSFEQGVFPDDFKIAIVIPKLKNESLDPEILSNYRPISNLIFLSKVLECLAFEQIISYFNVNSPLDDQQSAYRETFSTETALLHTFMNTRKMLDKHSFVFTVALDLQAAFDTLNHKVLLHICEDRFGIRYTAKKWLQSYLLGRTQLVLVNDSVSKPALLDSGLPQGSILGPMLFSVYLTPLGDLLKEIKVNYQLYADDTILYFECSSKHLQCKFR